MNHLQFIVWGDVMDLFLKNDDEILLWLAERLDNVRRMKGLKEEDLVKKGGTSRVIYSNFKHGKGGISLKSFIRILRGMGELAALEKLLSNYNGAEEGIPLHRVKDRKEHLNQVSWGEDR